MQVPGYEQGNVVGPTDTNNKYNTVNIMVDVDGGQQGAELVLHRRGVQVQGCE